MISLTPKRFTLGTVCINSVMKILGRLPILVVHKTTVAKCDTKDLALHTKFTLRFTPLPRMAKYSALRARYITLLIFSVGHSCFFIIMGLSLGLRGLLSAYAISSFSRAFLTGKFSNGCPHNLLICPICFNSLSVRL